MGGVFVIDWRLPDIQERVSDVEALEQPVCGTATDSPENAVDAILTTQPDVVLAWLNRHPERTLEVLRGLHRVVARTAGGAAGTGAAGALPPFVFVDTPPEVRGDLERLAPGAAFTTTYSDLKQVLRQVRRGR